jgi:hypothetical protein
MQASKGFIPGTSFPRTWGVFPKSITVGRAYGLRGACKGLLSAYGSKRRAFPFPPARKPATIVSAQGGPLW